MPNDRLHKANYTLAVPAPSRPSMLFFAEDAILFGGDGPRHCAPTMRINMGSNQYRLCCSDPIPLSRYSVFVFPHTDIFFQGFDYKRLFMEIVGIAP